MTYTIQEIDLMRERREAAELDIAAAHREMAKAVSRYGQDFAHSVHLPMPALQRLANIRDWADMLLRQANEA